MVLVSLKSRSKSVMGLFGGITGLAKKALGSATAFRKVLDVSPKLSGLVFPPQVSMGLKVAKTVGGVFGIKVPTESEILSFASGKVKGFMDGLLRPVDRVLGDAGDYVSQIETVNGKLLSFATKLDLKGKTAKDVLQSIDWLL